MKKEFYGFRIVAYILNMLLSNPERIRKRLKITIN